MFFQIFGGLLLLSQVVCGNDFGLTPREITATALNSSAIRVTWEEPSRSSELSGLYKLSVSHLWRIQDFNFQATEAIITDLEPSTTYYLAVCAFWRNGTPVNTCTSTFEETLPRDSPNSSEAIKGSFISVVGFFLLWLSLRVAL